MRITPAKSAIRDKVGIELGYNENTTKCYTFQRNNEMSFTRYKNTQEIQHIWATTYQNYSLISWNKNKIGILSVSAEE